MSLASSDLAAFDGGGLDGGSDANSDLVAASLSDAFLGGSGESRAAVFAGLDESALVVAAQAALALLVSVLDAVSAETGRGTSARAGGGRGGDASSGRGLRRRGQRGSGLRGGRG